MIYQNKEFKLLNFEDKDVYIDDKDLKNKDIFLIQIPKIFDISLLNGLSINLDEEIIKINEQQNIYLNIIKNPNDLNFLNQTLIVVPSQQQEENLKILVNQPKNFIKIQKQFEFAKIKRKSIIKSNYKKVPLQQKIKSKII